MATLDKPIEQRVHELETLVWEIPNILNLRFDRFDGESRAMRTALDDNTGRLNLLELTGEIDAKVLVANKVIADTLDGLRVLGDGELKKAFTIKAKHFTATAKAKIEKAGGKAVVEA